MGKSRILRMRLIKMLESKYMRGLLKINGVFFLVFLSGILSNFFQINNFTIVYSLLCILVLIPVIEVWGNVFGLIIGSFITVTSISVIYTLYWVKFWTKKRFVITIFVYFFIIFVLNVCRVEWGAF